MCARLAQQVKGAGQQVKGAGMTAALDISGIHKSFGSTDVLHGVDLTLAAGCVTVLMGANGAGKSTLVKILCGFYEADRGAMQIGGVPYCPQDAADAIRCGVVTVHQAIDDGVIPDLDVAGNLLLDRFAAPGARLFVHGRQMRTEAQAIADSMEIEVDMRRHVSALSVADRQMIAIARAMARSARVLILDEPTSSLSAREADRLFALIDRLRARGVAVLYISHRMSDIRRIADRIVCLRDGRISGMFEDAPLDFGGAVSAMLGRQTGETQITPCRGDAPVLEMEAVRLLPDTPPLDLVARDGEVVALTGLLGSGKSRLAEIVFGRARAAAGRMRIDGRPYAPRSPREAVARGVFMSPKDRGVNAVIPDFDIANNMSVPFLGAFSVLSFLNARRQRAAVDAMIAQTGIVCRSSRDNIGALSGGNQQKVMIARWLMRAARVIVFDEPFQGVDIGARRDISAHIRQTARGRATIVLMSELDEALEIADRIIIMHEHMRVAAHVNDRLDARLLVAQISGARGSHRVSDQAQNQAHAPVPDLVPDHKPHA